MRTTGPRKCNTFDEQVEFMVDRICDRQWPSIVYIDARYGIVRLGDAKSGTAKRLLKTGENVVGIYNPGVTIQGLKDDIIAAMGEYGARRTLLP